MVNNGLRDWVVQRLTALVIGAYAIFILLFLAFCPHASYATWQHLFDHSWMKVFSVVALFSIVWHAWIGVWTIFTDYVRPHCFRIALQTVVILALVYYLFWGIQILWGL